LPLILGLNVTMISISTVQHLRIPFSFNLLPIFLFALAINTNDLSWSAVLLMFISWHLFIYPSMNAYNSYFDKDEESIGGLKHPPKTTKQLYYYAIIFEIIGIALAALVDMKIALLVFICVIISKAYSHPGVRLKKYPILGWLTVAFFQGYFVFITSYMAMHGANWVELGQLTIQIPAILTSFMLFGSYPMTQIYQHVEDAKRGDLTISRKLGISGTFHFTLVAFTCAMMGYCSYFYYFQTPFITLIYILTMLPILYYFLHWYLKVRSDITMADFEHTMRLNTLSAFCLNSFFVGMFFFINTAT
jgi:1,4-dihydroxy-2-naphthoate octaprenyltransferase